MKARENQQVKESQTKREQEKKQRQRFRPAVERLEERISLSGLGHGHHGGWGFPSKGW
jgi:hypothetical protein